jgi:flagellar hook-associated protein 1 FlgK
MGLTSSLSTALTGLKVSQQSISVLAQNIANANNKDYTRQVVSQSTIAGNDVAGSGVAIDEVTRVVNEYVNRAVVTRGSITARAQVIDSYYEQSQIIIGQPGQANSIDRFTQKFFESMQRLSNDTENSSLKLSTVDSAKTLANEVSNLAYGIEELRYQADKEIQQSVGRVNISINKIFDLNIALGNAASLGQSVNTLSDKVEAELTALSKEINIQYTFNDVGQVTLNAANGILLIDSSGRYNLNYDSANSVQHFIDDTPSTPIEVVRVDVSGNLLNSGSAQLVSSGNRSEVTTPLTSGRIKGLLELRDKLFPDILNQLDNFVSVLRDEVNAIYNNGTAFPPETSLTGTTLINPFESNGWSGSILIGAVQVGSSSTDGQPVASPYASQTYGLKPLIIDLSRLSDEGGAPGSFKFQSIIDEINNYYGIPQNAVAIGDIANIELISKSDSLTAGTGSFNFNLETTNLSANNRNFTITGITPSDANIVVTQPAAFPSSPLTSNAGATEISSATNFSLNMSSGLIGAGPYTINVGISVDDGAGGFFTDTITYTISQASDGLINDRFAANAVSGSGNATIEFPTTIQPILTAKLVDANGVEIPKNSVGEYTSSGYLKLEGAANVGVAIAELNSKHLGSVTKAATNYGMSHYFGLNNFFATGDGTNPSQVADAAITFKLRDDIAASPGKIAVATLGRSSQPSIAGADPKYTYEISSGNNDTILALDALANRPVNFPAAGGISRTTVSFNNYAAQILGYSSTVSFNAAEDARKEELILQGFSDKKDSIGGVNVDEEIANTITFQNAYAANARVISVINEMFDSLLAAF